MIMEAILRCHKQLSQKPKLTIRQINLTKLGGSELKVEKRL